MTFPKRYAQMASQAVLSVLLSMALFAGAQAQRQPARQQLQREMARAKAERFAKIQAAYRAPTANQADYDVSYYDIHLTMDPNTATVAGTVTVAAQVVNALDVVDLDLAGTLTVNQVLDLGGVPYAFTHTNSILSVTLDRNYAPGELIAFTVDYSGPPDPSYGAFGFDSHEGQPMIWSLSEPFGARSWWPCKDVPSDKADSVDIRITVPKGLIVASNGTLRRVSRGKAEDRYWWHEGYAISTYLVSVAIYPYTVFSHWYHYAPSDSMEVRYYVFPDHYDDVQATYAKTVPMIELYSSLFGEYPFLEEKYGHAEFLWGGGMEHQTITSLGSWSEYLIAHELSHMWWGDMVTCNDFHHIWMNEGFATYCEALWSEFTYGDSYYQQDMQAAKYFGGGTIYVPETTDWNRIFHTGLSYNKGSWVLHMLRHVVGDSTFFDILETYYADSRYQYATVTTEQFRDLCEDVSGIDLDFFFHEWIYEEYYPSYSYNWTATPNGGLYDVNVTINQLQSHYLFKMPIDVRITTASDDTTTFVAWDSLATQSFTMSVADPPTSVLLDPDEWILRTVEEPLGNPTFDRGILLVNGVDFATYGSEIWSAYEDSTFWGSYDISFWDCFEETSLGYPDNLPTPLGHGYIPSDSLKQFSTVVWVGNNYNGDLTEWFDTSILSYLNAGGNVLLMTRYGQSFVTEPMRQYLGITWRESGATLDDCVAAYPGLSDMDKIGTQNTCATFDTALATGESEILFEETLTFSTHRGVGVWRKPASGGTDRTDGAQLVFLSGRPYRWNHDQLRANVEFILGGLFGEPYTPPTGVTEQPPASAFGLAQNYPNPFNPHTTMRFSLPERRMVQLRVYDVTGKLVANLADRMYPAGAHSIEWDGTNRSGQPAASGIYFYRLQAGSDNATRKMLLLR
jgi:aminopeptidase N